MKYAWIENDRVRDCVSSDPFSLFTADIAEHYGAEVPDEAANGDGWVDGKLVKPEPLPPTDPLPSPIPLIGPIAFQMLFTVQELVAIDEAKATHPEVRLLWKLVDDPRTDVIDRNLSTIQSGILMLESLGLLAAGRAQEILHGTAS